MVEHRVFVSRSDGFGNIRLLLLAQYQICPNKMPGRYLYLESVSPFKIPRELVYAELSKSYLLRLELTYLGIDFPSEQTETEDEVSEDHLC